MANQEDFDIDIALRSFVSQLRELHEKHEEKILKLMKAVEETATDSERETMRTATEMLIKDREEVRKLLEDHAVFVNSRNNNNSPEKKTSRMEFLKECVEKFKNIDLGNQERQSCDHFGDQERGKGSYSSGYVADGEMEQKQPIFSFDESDTSSEVEMELWHEKNVDPDLKRRFLQKAMDSCLLSYEKEIEIEIEESCDAFDDKGFTTNIKELWEQRDLFIAGTSEEESSEDVKKDGGDADVEYSGDDGHISSNVEELVEDLKKLNEGKDMKFLITDTTYEKNVVRRLT